MWKFRREAIDRIRRSDETRSSEDQWRGVLREIEHQSLVDTMVSQNAAAAAAKAAAATAAASEAREISMGYDQTSPEVRKRRWGSGDEVRHDGEEAASSSHMQTPPSAHADVRYPTAPTTTTTIKTLQDYQDTIAAELRQEHEEREK